MELFNVSQADFDAVNCEGLNKPALEAIVRCRCQPNTCSRPVCSGCVQCLGRCHRFSLSDKEQTQLLADFLAF